MIKKKRQKYSKRKLSIFVSMSCFLVVMIAFIYTFISYIVQIGNLEKTEKDLNNKLLELQNKNIDLRVEIEKLKDPDYLARYARENFLYSKDGEYVIRIDKNDNVTIEMNTDKVNKYENVLIILSIFILLIILCIVIKMRIKKIKNIKIQSQYIKLRK